MLYHCAISRRWQQSIWQLGSSARCTNLQQMRSILSNGREDELVEEMNFIDSSILHPTTTSRWKLCTSCWLFLFFWCCIKKDFPQHKQRKQRMLLAFLLAKYFWKNCEGCLKNCQSHFWGHLFVSYFTLSCSCWMVLSFRNVWKQNRDFPLRAGTKFIQVKIMGNWNHGRGGPPIEHSDASLSWRNLVIQKIWIKSVSCSLSDFRQSRILYKMNMIWVNDWIK